MFCPNCGNNCGNVAFCPVCGSKLNAQENIPPASSVNAPVSQTPEKPKKKKVSKKLIILPIVAVIVVAAIVLGAVAIGFTSNPMVKLANGINKLLFDAESFAFNIEFTDDYSRSSSSYDSYGYLTNNDYSRKSKCNIDGAIAWGENLASTSYFADVNYKNTYGDGDSQKYKYNFVSAGGETLFWGDDFEVGFSFNTPDAYKYIKDNQNELSQYFFDSDVDDVDDMLKDEINLSIKTITYWIENIVSGNKLNEDLFIEIYNDWVRGIVEEYGDVDAEDIPDYATIRDILVDFIAKGISEDSVEIKDTFKEDGITKYNIKINLESAAKELYKYLSDCEELKELLDSEIGEEFMDEFDYAIDNDYFEDEEFEFIAGVSKGYLAYFEFKYSENWEYNYENGGYENSENEITVKITFSNFNEHVDFGAKYNEIGEEHDNNWFKFKNLEDVERFIDNY